MDARAFAPMHDDMIALGHVRHARPDLGYYPAALVSEQVGKKLVFALGTGDFAQLGTADSAAMDLDQHLTVLQTGHVEVIDDEGRIQSLEYRSFHFHIAATGE